MRTARVAAALSLWLVTAPGLQASGLGGLPRAVCPAMGAADTQLQYLGRVRRSCDAAWRGTANPGATHATFLTRCARQCTSNPRLARDPVPNVGMGTDADASVPAKSVAVVSATVGPAGSALVVGAMLGAAIASGALSSRLSPAPASAVAPNDRPASP